MSNLEQLQQAVAKFKTLQEKYKKYGCRDTEPDSVFQWCLVDAYNGRFKKFSQNEIDWQIFNTMSCADKVAEELTEQLKVCVAIIIASNHSEIKNYLNAICWRTQGAE